MFCIQSPLAGKIELDDISISCNDDGAYFVEAQVDCNLLVFLRCPENQIIQRFLPCQPNEGTDHYILMVQVNQFKCGGIAIGICTSHKIIDGASLSSFLMAWMANAHALAHGGSATEEVCPRFVAPDMFPQNNLLPKGLMMLPWDILVKTGKSVLNRFVFDASAISRLKATTHPSFMQQNPIRVEVVFAFIWKCVMATSISKNGHQRPSVLSSVVNIRKRSVPPLPPHSIGNFVLLTYAATCITEDPEMELELPHLVGHIRESIAKINGNFISNLQGEEGFLNVCKAVEELHSVCSKPGVDYFSFTSWCKFAFYEADFGWGKPTWVTPKGTDSPIFNEYIILIDTKTGDGIEAWVNLAEQDMTILQSNAELLNYAAINPSPLRDI